MKRILGEADRFSKESGMKFNARKCASFVIRGKGKTWTVEEKTFTLGSNDRIPVLGAGQLTKYLGMKVGPWGGVESCNTELRLKHMIERINSAPLKPTQRLHMLHWYGVPRLLYGLVGPRPVSQAALERLDLLIRGTVKQWLRLPGCTSNGLLYSCKRDGGLALPWLSRSVPLAQLRRLNRLLGHRDPTVRSAARAGGLSRVYAKQAGIVAVQKGKGFRREAYRIWCEMKPQGFGVESFQANPTSHEPLRYHSRLYREWQRIAVTQMRSNVFPTKEALLRGTEHLPPCRFCGPGTVEDLFHVLGKCDATQKLRIERHDRIVEALGEHLRKKGFDVLREPRVHGGGGCLVPDLVAIDSLGETLYVLDPTIVAEGRLEQSYQLKVDKYSDEAFLSNLRARFPSVRRVRVHGVPLGVRGIIPRVSEEVLTSLQCTRGLIKQLLRDCVIGSLKCCSLFGKGGEPF